MRRIAAAAIVVLAFFIVAVVGWELTYPSESDPKNIKYVLWKTGWYQNDSFRKLVHNLCRIDKPVSPSF
jgi:hypothetical protein